MRTGLYRFIGGTFASLFLVFALSASQPIPDCAKGCQNAAKIAEAAGDPLQQVLDRLHQCLDMCRN